MKMEENNKLGPAGFGRFLHDAFNLAQTEITESKKNNNIYCPSIFLIYTAVDALLSSMLDQKPDDPFIRELKDKLSLIDKMLGRSPYKFEHARLEKEEMEMMGTIIEQILRKLGVIRSGSVDSDESNECALMEEELK